MSTAVSESSRIRGWSRLCSRLELYLSLARAVVALSRATVFVEIVLARFIRASWVCVDLGVILARMVGIAGKAFEGRDVSSKEFAFVISVSAMMGLSIRSVEASRGLDTLDSREKEQVLTPLEWEIMRGKLVAAILWERAGSWELSELIRPYWDEKDFQNLKSLEPGSNEAIVAFQHLAGHETVPDGWKNDATDPILILYDLVQYYWCTGLGMSC